MIFVSTATDVVILGFLITELLVCTVDFMKLSMFLTFTGSDWSRRGYVCVSYRGTDTCVHRVLLPLQLGHPQVS